MKALIQMLVKTSSLLPFKRLFSTTSLLNSQFIPNIGLTRAFCASMYNKDLIFRQLFESISCTYTYLLGDAQTKEAVIIDPVLETVDRDAKLIAEMDLTLKYAMNTHVHADHVTGSGLLKQKIPGAKSVIAAVSQAKADVLLNHGDKVKFGQFEIEARSTPGHTDGCMSFIFHQGEMAFTGDALLIRGCGRTDFQQGSPSRLYESVHTQILSLPDNYILFPAHDYQGRTATSVLEEKTHNPRLTKSLEEFVNIMNNLNLSYPKQIDRALPANLQCGLYEVPSQ